MAEGFFWTDLGHIPSASIFKLLAAPEEFSLVAEIKK